MLFRSHAAAAEVTRTTAVRPTRTRLIPMMSPLQDPPDHGAISSAVMSVRILSCPEEPAFNTCGRKCPRHAEHGRHVRASHRSDHLGAVAFLFVLFSTPGSPRYTALQHEKTGTPLEGGVPVAHRHQRRRDGGTTRRFSRSGLLQVARTARAAVSTSTRARAGTPRAAVHPHRAQQTLPPVTVSLRGDH